jgi:hypothetical protein
MLARGAPRMAFTTLAHHIDVPWLREAFRLTRKDGALGVERQVPGLSALSSASPTTRLVEEAAGSLRVLRDSRSFPYGAIAQTMVRVARYVVNRRSLAHCPPLTASNHPIATPASTLSRAIDLGLVRIVKRVAHRRTEPGPVQDLQSTHLPCPAAAAPWRRSAAGSTGA